MTSPYKDWPSLARAIARFRTAEDAGIGDTIHRNLKWLGADAMVEAWNALMGSECACGMRKIKLNQKYPYQRQ